MSYKHLGQSERDRIEALLRAGHSQVEIASVLKVNKSTVSREIKRRKRVDGRYDAELAEHKAYVKRLRSKYRGMKIEENHELRTHIITELNNKRSPDEIAGRLNQEAGHCVVNCKAIYKWLYSIYGQKYCHLLCTRRRRPKRQKLDKKPRIMIPNLVSIHNISEASIHFEGDTFVSPKRYQTTVSVALVVERDSKLILARKVPSLKPGIMVKTMKGFQKKVTMKNIVLDRGIENRYHGQFGVPAYFADPQSPHQKPLAEGSIGLSRRWFWKKGTDLSKVSDKEIQWGINILNNKYRKSLQYRSALEVAGENGILREEIKD